MRGGLCAQTCPCRHLEVICEFTIGFGQCKVSQGSCALSWNCKDKTLDQPYCLWVQRVLTLQTTISF